MGLAGYHLPLDGHPEIGNNALIADALGCESRDRFLDVGFAARFPGDGIPASELFERVHALTGREPLVFDAGPDRVRTIAIVSGAAAGLLDEAVAAGLDAFLTGEPKEQVMGTAREAGVHFIAAGHYATETFGIRRLGELARRAVRGAPRVHRCPEPGLRASRNPALCGRFDLSPSGWGDIPQGERSTGGVHRWRFT